MINIIINGANGMMGRVIAAMAKKSPSEYNVVAGIDAFGVPNSENNFEVFKNILECNIACDVIIDFSMPDALENVLNASVARKCALVVATTGLTEAHYESIEKASRQIPIFVTANMSLGVNLQMDIISRVAAFLGDSFDIEIVESHHSQKVDAPSGTAIALADAICGEFPSGKELIYDRHLTRSKRKKSEIGMHSIRGGTVVGQHNVIFLGEDEIIEVNHIAQSKRIFAVGALRAASYIFGREPKVYSMREIVADQNSVTNLYSQSDQSIVTISGVDHSPSQIAKIFSLIANENINIDMISQTMPSKNRTVDLCFTLPSKSLQLAVDILSKNNLKNVSYTTCVAKFSIEGLGMEHRPGIAAKMFEVFSQANINVQLVTTSETKISYCIDQKDIEKARAATLKAFELK